MSNYVTYPLIALLALAALGGVFWHVLSAVLVIGFAFLFMTSPIWVTYYIVRWLNRL